ncbi:MAG: chloride channel protein [Pseudomonadota bacterium]|nr:chloride channel protein [Pseudomonadota bacterium]
MTVFSRNIKYIRMISRMWPSYLIFWGGGIGIAIAATILAKGGEYAYLAIHRLIDTSPFIPIFLAPCGFALCAWLTRRFFPGIQGSGIPQTIAALQLENPEERKVLLSLRIAFSKMFITLLGLFSGASIGREGPTVQIGSSIMYAMGGWMKIRQRTLEKALILAGGAAGIAAAFNTPLAGVVFAIEELSRNFEERTSGTVITAIIIAGITSLALMGNYSYFGHTAAALNTPRDWVAVPFCGIIGGLLGGIYSRILLIAAKGLPGKFGDFMREKPVRFALVCGIAIGIIGFLSHNSTYCTGYNEARTIVEGKGVMPASFGILKMLASIISYASGIPGGIFSPSLAVGAGFGANLAQIIPYAPPAAIIMLGMAAYFAGVVQAPITVFVIVTEMTDNHNMAIPLMAVSLIATATSKMICREPIYKALSERFIQKQAKPAAVDITSEMG